MSGNILGKLFTVTTFGESHGLSVGCIIDGCPPGIYLSENYIQLELNRRRPGGSKYVTKRNELDKIKILSGIFNKITTGTSIMLIIKNNNNNISDYNNIINIFRPGHADFTYWKKYGIYDYRGGGHSSARLTSPIVAAGSIARKWLFEKYKIIFYACISQVGSLKIPFRSWIDVNYNPFFLANYNYISIVKKYLINILKSGDSCGARIDILVNNIPIGLGQPIYDKLDASIAYVLMGINAVKGVEIGCGFNSIKYKGSRYHGSFYYNGFSKNNSGGILGGISNGEDINISIALKPTSSINKSCFSMNIFGNNVDFKVFGRHDPCVGIRAIPIAESMISIVIINHILSNIAQCGKNSLYNSY